MHIIATDTLGNNYRKEIELIQRERGLVVSLGYPIQWYLTHVESVIPEHGGRFYIDVAGRSHRGQPVFVDHADLMDRISILKARQ